MLFHEPRIEAVVARRHRRVRGEHHFARDARHRRVERNALLLHPAANRFQHRESAVPFVQMQHARRDPHGFQRAESANAQQQFLPDAHAPVSAVQARSQLAIFRSIAFDIESSSSRSQRPTFTRQTFARIVPPRVSICTVTGTPSLPIAGFHRQAG